MVEQGAIINDKWIAVDERPIFLVQKLRFFFYQNQNTNFCFLILFQLIGWQEVPRPNSRTEIVQAMRRIRVSKSSTSFLNDAINSNHLPRSISSPHNICLTKHRPAETLFIRQIIQHCPKRQNRLQSCTHTMPIKF